MTVEAQDPPPFLYPRDFTRTYAWLRWPPAFSIFGTDAIYYGANLMDYLESEVTGWSSRPWPTQIEYIPFWSDLVERFAQIRSVLPNER